MSILNFSGFETADINESYSSTGTFSFQTSTARNGGYALKINPTGGKTGNLRMGGIQSDGRSSGIQLNVSAAYNRFYFNIETAPASADEEIFVLLDTAGAYKGSVRLNSSRQLVLYNSQTQLVGTGSTVLATGTWYRIEFYNTNGSSGSYEVRINGATEFSGTMNQGDTNLGSVRLGKGTNRNDQGLTVYYDDWRVDSAAWPGAGQCLRLQPAADGSTASWTGGTNSSNYLEVDEIASDDDTTYIKCATGGTHLVTLSTAGISGVIAALKAYARVREDTSDSSANKIRIKSGSSTSDCSTYNGSTSYTTRNLIAETDPATSAAWTLAGLQSVEIGVVEVNSVAMRCTQIAGFIDFVPASANIAQTIPKVAQAASASVSSGVSATIAQTTPKITQTASGVEGFSASVVQTIPKIAQVGSGVEGFSASVSQTAPRTGQSVSAIESFSASIAQTTSRAGQTAVALEVFVASVSQTLNKVVSTAVGVELFSSAASQSLAIAVQNALAETSVTDLIGAIESTILGCNQSAQAALMFSAGISQTIAQCSQVLIAGAGTRIAGSISLAGSFDNVQTILGSQDTRVALTGTGEVQTNIAGEI